MCALECPVSSRASSTSRSVALQLGAQAVDLLDREPVRVAEPVDLGLQSLGPVLGHTPLLADDGHERHRVGVGHRFPLGWQHPSQPCAAAPYTVRTFRSSGSGWPTPCGHTRSMTSVSPRQFCGQVRMWWSVGLWMQQTSPAHTLAPCTFTIAVPTCTPKIGSDTCTPIRS